MYEKNIFSNILINHIWEIENIFFIPNIHQFFFISKLNLWTHYFLLDLYIHSLFKISKSTYKACVGGICNCNNNSILSKVPQVGSGEEDECTQTLLLPQRDRETVSGRLPAQIWGGGGMCNATHNWCKFTCRQTSTNQS